MIPLFRPAVLGGVARRINHYALVTSSTDGSGGDFTFPSGVQAGDVLVVGDWATRNSATLPSTVDIGNGFSNLWNAWDQSNDTSHAHREMFWWKIADGTESGLAMIGMNSDAEGKVMAIFRAYDVNNVSIPLSAFSQTDKHSGGGGTARTTNSVGENRAHILFWFGSASIYIASSEPTYDGVISTGNGKLFYRFSDKDEGGFSDTIDLSLASSYAGASGAVYGIGTVA